MQDLNRKNANPSKQTLKFGGISNTEAKDNANEFSDEMRALAEENEALRKGLHEILDGLQRKNGDIVLLLFWLLIMVNFCFKKR